MAGGSPTRSTCACRDIRRACARWAGQQTGAGSRAQAPNSSCSGRFRARTVQWARRRACSLPSRCGSRPSPAIRRQEVVAVGYADGTVLLVRVEDGAEVLAKKPGNAPMAALGWNAAGNMLAWGTEEGEAGSVGALRVTRALIQSSQRGLHAGEFADVCRHEQQIMANGVACNETVIAVRSVSRPRSNSARTVPRSRASSWSNAQDAMRRPEKCRCRSMLSRDLVRCRQCRAKARKP